MAQDFGKNINTKNAVRNKSNSSNKLILGEEVTVYAGAGLAAAGIAFGTKMNVHPNLAKKLLAAGKVTEAEPSEKEKAKEEKAQESNKKEGNK